MAVIAPIPREKASPELQAVYDGLTKRAGRVPGFYGVMAHHPGALKNFLPLYASVMDEGTFEPRYKELAYLKTSHLNGFEYCSRAHCAELIKAEAIKCRFCGSELAKDPSEDGRHVEASQEKRQAAGPPTVRCPSCGVSIDATQGFCDVCSATILKPAAQPAGDASEAGAGTWHLILDHRAAEERREALLTALRGLSLDPTVTASMSERSRSYLERRFSW